MDNILWIHSDNIACNDMKNQIKFQTATADIDRYISTVILPQIIKREFEIICIKDAFMDDYLSFLGLRVAHHIRLSQELGEKRFRPVLIVSELDVLQINKLSTLGRILFTKGVYFTHNNEASIEKAIVNIPNTGDEDISFLDQIIIEKPEQNSHHDIANQWAIERWSRALRCESEVIEENRKSISMMLYFKYLNCLYKKIHAQESYAIPQLQRKGKILYIDDESDTGWGDVMCAIFKGSEIEFDLLAYGFKDVNKFKMLPELKQKIEAHDPDVVVLDLRLVESDHNQDIEVSSLSGIKILNLIKEINPAIQVIMMTATRQSNILEKLYQHGILGYIKKDHPLQNRQPASKSIQKLTTLVEEGLKKKWLKEVWEITEKISDILDKNPFDSYHVRSKQHSDILKKEIPYIFEVLNSDMKNKLAYAVISMAVCVDTIIKIFIDCPYDKKERKTLPCSYLGEEIDRKFKNVPEKMIFIIEKITNTSVEKSKKEAFYQLNEMRNNYVHSNKEITPQNNQLLKWLKTLEWTFEQV